MLNRLADKAIAADLHRFLALMEDFGVEYNITLVSPVHYIPFSTGGYIITMREGNRKVDGYFGFRTDFDFHSDGSFQIMGVWE